MADLARDLIKTIIENNWIKNHLQLRSVHLAMALLHLSHRSSDLFNLESLRINIRNCTYFKTGYIFQDRLHCALWPEKVATVTATVTATVVGITWQSESSMSHVRALWR
jgi:hypothetical protein